MIFYQKETEKIELVARPVQSRAKPRVGSRTGKTRESSPQVATDPDKKNNKIQTKIC